MKLFEKSINAIRRIVGGIKCGLDKMKLLGKKILDKLISGVKCVLIAIILFGKKTIEVIISGVKYLFSEIGKGFRWLKSMKGQQWLWRQRWSVIWRLSIVSAIIFALFWGIWKLTGNPIPKISASLLPLPGPPMGWSRFSDIPITPIWCAIMVVFLTFDWKYKKILRLIAIVSLAFGIYCGLAFGLFCILLISILYFVKWVLVDKKIFKRMLKFLKK